MKVTEMPMLRTCKLKEGGGGLTRKNRIGNECARERLRLTNIRNLSDGISATVLEERACSRLSWGCRAVIWPKLILGAGSEHGYGSIWGRKGSEGCDLLTQLCHWQDDYFKLLPCRLPSTDFWPRSWIAPYNIYDDERLGTHATGSLNSA